jgi:hypothetical protein
MTTASSPPVQASDEPMRAVIALAWKWHDEAVASGFAGSEASQELFELLGWPDRGATPRATADVEQDAARYRWLRENVVSLVRTRAEKDSELREQEWIDWEASADAHIAATKGAKP